jgi:hypothetical protein
MTIPKEINRKNAVFREDDGWISTIPFRYHFLYADFDKPLFMLEDYFEQMAFRNVLVGKGMFKFVHV